MDAEDELALATALLGAPQPNMPTKPNTPRSPRSPVAAPTGPEAASTNAIARRRMSSEGDRGIVGGRLVSCLKDAPRSSRPQRSKSVRVRFVRTPREASQGPSLDEGAMLVGRSPPRVTDQPKVSPRVLTATRAHRRQEDARHGYCPPETPPEPPPSPPLTTTTTTTATPRGVAPRPVASAPTSSSRAVARVQVRGDLDTTVIGEVHRENMLRYSGDLSRPVPSDQSSSSVTTAPTKLRITVPTAGHSHHQADQGVSATDDNSANVTATVSVQGVAQRSRTRPLGDRQNVRVTYTSCQPTAPVPAASTGSSTASSTTPTGAVPTAETPTPGAGGFGTGAGAAQPQEMVGRPGTSMAARVVIRRRRPATQEKHDSDTDSVDRIDIDNRPHVGVRRAMSLRTPARQVWTPDQSTPSQAAGTEVTPATTPRTPIRRAFSLRILPRRVQQQPAVPVTAGEAAAGGGTDAAATANVPDKKAIVVENPPQEKGRARDASSTVSKVSPSQTQEPKESAPSAVPAAAHQGDLLSSCMGGLGQSSTKWLAEQNRKRALKSLEPVTHFSAAPEAQPLTICFEYEGCGLSHKSVLDAVEKTIHRYRDTKVVKIQFVPRSIVLCSMWLPNRWVVTVNNDNAQRALIAGGVSFWGKEVKCRKYDDVLAEEYKRFLEQEERLAE